MQESRMDIFSILYCLNPCLDRTTLRRSAVIVSAILSVPDRVTMPGISRWTEKGGSCRTIQRFFKTKIDRAKVQRIFIRTRLRGNSGVALSGGDEVITPKAGTPKAGKKTYGPGRFFSSIYGKPIPGMRHLQLSLISVETETSYPLITQQMRQSEKQKSKKQPVKIQIQTQNLTTRQVDNLTPRFVVFCAGQCAKKKPVNCGKKRKFGMIIGQKSFEKRSHFWWD